MTNKNNRLLALDILRGITIAGMILVNNPGDWGVAYLPLSHAHWHGLAPADLVFPFFMFIMGISAYISLRKYNFERSRSTLLKIAKRTVLIFLIGLGITWFSLALKTYNNLSAEEIGLWERMRGAVFNFEHLRIMGVMQRLAISYGVTALIAIYLPHRLIPYIVGALLVAYFFILYGGNGFEFSEDNIISIVDRAILGREHVYVSAGVALDPEGLLSTVAAICNVLIGFCAGGMLMCVKDNDQRVQHLFVWGTILLFAGFLLSYGCSINKKIWSPTYVLVTCGAAATLLGLLIWIVDIKGYKRWAGFFRSFGVNPLFIYVFAEVLGTLLYRIRVDYAGEILNLRAVVYSKLFQPLFGEQFGSLVYSLLFVAVCWGVGDLLDKKKIYIKL